MVGIFSFQAFFPCSTLETAYFSIHRSVRTRSGFNNSPSFSKSSFMSSFSVSYSEHELDKNPPSFKENQIENLSYFIVWRARRHLTLFPNKWRSKPSPRLRKWTTALFNQSSNFIQFNSRHPSTWRKKRHSSK